MKNRELKFRAWDKDTRIMSYSWDEHSLISDILAHKLSRPSSTSDLVKKHRNDFIFMQYTGLKDRNGTEIYEGDIISSNGAVAFIQHGWSNDLEYGWLICHNKTRYIINKQDQIDEDYEVIGNVHENPDLLQPHKEARA